MSSTIGLPPEADLAALGFTVHRYEADSLALQREPFRMSWIATQLVTFVFVIRRQVTSWEEMAADFAAMKSFAKQHKKTFLPMGFQCGYALLPIYVGAGFSDELRETVRSTFKKRWCMMHLPSLLDLATGECTSLAANHIWGVIYRTYVADTITSVSDVVVKHAAS